MNKLFKSVIIVILATLCVLTVSACAKSTNPYEANGEDGYTVTVRYDANGGTFATNTSVIVDSYNPGDFPSGSIPLVAPDDERRGDMAMSAKLGGGYFLAGWYTERTPVTDADGNHLDHFGNRITESGKPAAYTYSGHWDFEGDRLDLSTLENDTVTLYAAWVPEFSFEFYDIDSGELVGTKQASYLSSITLPTFNAGTGKMDKKDFPDVIGKTYDRDGGIYTDKDGTAAVVGGALTHTGVLDLDTATASGEKMKIYIDFLEGSRYWISTPEQLISNADPSAHYVIEADLDFEGKRWPFSGNFSGSIDGGGHTFKNITAKQSSLSQQAGLFPTLTASAEIFDLTFENVSYTIEAGSNNAGPSYGLFAGRIIEGARIENVSVTGTLTVTSSARNGKLSGNGEDYSLGLICGTGYEFCNIDYSGITLVGVNDDRSYNVVLSSDGNTVSWVREKK